MLKQWEDSTGHRESLLMAGARRVGVASVDNPKSSYRKLNSPRVVPAHAGTHTPCLMKGARG